MLEKSHGGLTFFSPCNTGRKILSYTCYNCWSNILLFYGWRRCQYKSTSTWCPVMEWE